MNLETLSCSCPNFSHIFLVAARKILILPKFLRLRRQLPSAPEADTAMFRIDSTVFMSTSQLLIMIRAVSLDFHIAEDMQNDIISQHTRKISFRSIHGRTTGEDSSLEAKKTLQCYDFD